MYICFSQSRNPSIPVEPVSQKGDGFDDADRLRVVEPNAAAASAAEEGGDGGGVVEHGVLEVLHPDRGAARAAVVGVVAVAVVHLQAGATLLVGRYLWDK